MKGRAVEQSVARRSHVPEVAGSSPARAIAIAELLRMGHSPARVAAAVKHADAGNVDRALDALRR